VAIRPVFLLNCIISIANHISDCEMSEITHTRPIIAEPGQIVCFCVCAPWHLKKWWLEPINQSLAACAAR